MNTLLVLSALVAIGWAQKTDQCSQPKKTGPCRGHHLRWYLDAGSRQCRQFIYGGCQGNMNNFDSREQCQQTCVAKKAKTVPPVCNEPPEVGECRGYFPKWYYNVDSGRCEIFIYGGCRGNANRFDSQEECAHACG